MIAGETHSKSAFETSIELLLSLHRQNLAGNSESGEAHQIREQMEDPWYAMGELEQKHVRGLSADLYSIGASRSTANPHIESTAIAELKRLVANDSWYEILDLVRKAETSLSSRAVSYTRGLCWAQVGQPDVAIEFLKETARLGPLTPAEELLLQTCYVHAGRAQEIVARAIQIKASEVHPLLLLKAAEILSIAAEEARDETAMELRHAAIDCAERGFEFLQSVALEPENRQVLDALEVPAYLHLALSYDQVGKREKALDACRKALAIAPDSSNALLLWGFLTFDGISTEQRKRFTGNFFDRLAAEEPIAHTAHEFLPTAA